MGDATTVLFGLDGFRVVSVSREHEHDDRTGHHVREVVVEGVEQEQACPDCGVLSGSVHGRKLRRVKDLPFTSVPEPRSAARSRSSSTRAHCSTK